ncbi:hypothetical protein L596_027165 [Steinernema carpocapsae]|uniref:Uncharacterized protein n=1 Tax=Steinernema carpocapsae TaxID=34508 RepID=A0A4U5M4I4_STECR|nr:hypothetical protein L596_027165 [Steinernema carpocapsae]
MSICTNFKVVRFFYVRDGITVVRTREVWLICEICSVDKLLHFFIDPKLTEGTLEDKIESIHNECLAYKKKDNCRRDNIEQWLARRDHKFHKNNAASRRSLKEIPEAKEINVLATLKKFFYDRYSSRIMTACLMDKKPMEEIAEMQPYIPHELSYRVDVFSVKDQDTIDAFASSRNRGLIKKESLLDYFNEKLSAEASERRRICVYIPSRSGMCL